MDRKSVMEAGDMDGRMGAVSVSVEQIPQRAVMREGSRSTSAIVPERAATR